MHIADRPVMATQLVPKGEMRSSGVFSVVFKTPRCASHIGISLVRGENRYGLELMWLKWAHDH